MHATFAFPSDVQTARFVTVHGSPSSPFLASQESVPSATAQPFSPLHVSSAQWPAKHTKCDVADAHSFASSLHEPPTDGLQFANEKKMTPAHKIAGKGLRIVRGRVAWERE